MDLADACVVRLGELYPEAKVMTLDADFRVYRRNGRQAIPLIAPPVKQGRRVLPALLPRPHASHRRPEVDGHLANLPSRIPAIDAAADVRRLA